MHTQPKLFNEIMGQFDLINNVDIFRASHPNKIEIHFTFLHEEAHRKAISICRVHLDMRYWRAVQRSRKKG